MVQKSLVALGRLDLIRREAYSIIVVEKRDVSRISRVLEKVGVGKITRNNYWVEIRRMSSNCKEDHSIRRWEIISEWLYNRLIEKSLI